MDEMSTHGKVGLAAMKSGMDRKTARKYVKAGKLPSQMKKERHWRTRKDPFAEDWPAMAAMLEDAPALEAKALFEHLCREKPGKYKPGQLRTFQRRVKAWRAQHGPAKEVFFPQEHRPGEALQTDFTWCNELGVTIAGEPFEHLLCHVVLPYSDWQCATPCRSESMAALSEGLQRAVFRLGRVAEYHQTDNSTAATHDLPSGKRDYNERYLALMRHLGMTPRTTAIGAKEQNGDVEAANGALKRRLEQHLLLRGHRDFASGEAYLTWLDGILKRANDQRSDKLAEDLEAMRPLQVNKLASYTEKRVRVTAWSTIRVKQNTYSVPSRLIDERVKVRVHDDRLEVFHGQSLQVTMPRLHGRQGHRINYRHIVWSLVRKPGAFRRYRYRDDLFPTVRFRKAYDALVEALTDRQADLEYLRVLHLAASTVEADVEVALGELLEDGVVPTAERVKAVVAPREPEQPELEAFDPDVEGYDELLEGSR